MHGICHVAAVGAVVVGMQTAAPLQYEVPQICEQNETVACEERCKSILIVGL